MTIGPTPSSQSSRIGPREAYNMGHVYALRLNSWVSAGMRAVIVGGAAYEIPPTAGQGVNQAFEDTYALSLLLLVSGKTLN
jgi:2-polyprenyl-6-methoxyphenol hydroxylase-like FAD-dependent oxidoreductase